MRWRCGRKWIIKAKDIVYIRAQAKKGLVIAIDYGIDRYKNYVLDGEIIGKPLTAKCAIAYLQRFSGRSHDFYTGMAIIDTVNDKEIIDYVHAKVYFRNLSLTEITQYIEKEEVLTAAGSYRIQGLGAALIKKLEGDYYAVVGISPSKLTEMFKKLGYNLFDYVRG